MLPVMLAAAVAVGILTGFLAYKLLSDRKLKGTREQSDQLLRDAFQEADRRKREMLTEAKEEIFRLRQDAEREIKERRAEQQRAERRLEQKEENLDAKMNAISQREEDFRKKQEEFSKRAEEVEAIRQKHVERLEEIARMTREQAKDVLLQEVEQEASHVIGLRLKDLEEKAKRDSERKSREVVVSAIQRCAVDHTSEMSVSVVSLPSDEMKGRIIGREGRNIRAFETFTGVDLIVDDTPEAVTLSSFDPVRREVARLSLERLVLDGRIHPARIEEIVEKAQKDVEEKILEAGEEALIETGIKSMHPELVKTIGQLRYRSSYGQNALSHSLEVSHLAGIMAAELGIDEHIARRAGLLHDIGKAVDHQVEGPHALIGRDMAKRFGEIPEVVNAIAAHHEDEEMISVFDVLISAADAISASRPGARRESLDSYIKRLEKLETLAKTFKGVTKAYAIQAGREVRVMVAPNSLDDGAIHKLAYDIARKIEGEMKYPGQIKVIVIRETRSVEFAK